MYRNRKKYGEQALAVAHNYKAVLLFRPQRVKRKSFGIAPNAR